MAELNDKLITYGNLSTFYDKLQEQGLGGNAIEDASVLPDAGENKSKLIRLDNGDKDVYAAKLLSSETITTNRLPDAQQIDKAYLYDGDVYYYKGVSKLICTDGEIDGYVWQNVGYFIFTLDNAINTTLNTIYFSISKEEDNEWSIEGNIATTYDYNISDVQNTFEDLSAWGMLAVIPATYNAPESAQIGNAYIRDDDNSYRGIYDGTQATFIDSDGSGEEVTGYKWIVDGETDFIATSKPASEIYYAKVLGEMGYSYYTDVIVWVVDAAEGTSVRTIIELGDNGIYIPQLNAPDSEQVGNAYFVEEYNGGWNCIYTGEESTINVNDNDITVYRWLPVESQTSYYSTKRANEIYNTNRDSNDVHFYVDDAGDITELTFENTDISLISTVKYQRTEVTEEWDWQPLTDNATNDDIDLMFNSESPVVKRVLMKEAKLDEETAEPKYPLSLGEGLVNENDETMEWDGQTYYKWVLYEEDADVSSIDYSCMGEQMIYLTTTLNPSLPFDRDSSECAYVITDGEDDYNGSAKIYPKIALIHEDGSITYEE